MYTYTNTIKAFSEIEHYTYIEEKSYRIKKEIVDKGKEYILSVDENEYIEYLISKYNLEILVLDMNNSILNEPVIKKEWLEDRIWQEKYEAEVYTFTVSYKFSGSPELFKVKPGIWNMSTYDIYVNETNSTVSLNFKLYKKDPDEFKNVKQRVEKMAFINLNNVNNLATEWNNSLPGLAKNTFQQHKRKLKEENDFFAAINVKVNQETDSVFSVPTIKKKVIPQPAINMKKEFSSEPMMSREMYDDILKVIYDSGKSMEKKPALYQNKDEEGLRDQFLFILETRYVATTATGETFNRGGKTDIILKYANDGSNLFVAECKFWHGITEFHRAISQLFDRYLTWRDSKVALIMFVTNKDFSNVLLAVRKNIINHPYYLKSLEQRGETSFSYLFHLPQDNEKPVHLEVMLFHYDK